MYSRRIHRWVFELITKFYPRYYFRRHDPIVRPPRKPIHLEIDLLDRRESPTNVSPVGPGAAWLAPFLSAAEPLPALVQTSPAFDFNHPFPASGAEGQINPARIANRSAAQAEETSPLSPWGGTAGYGVGNDGATASPTPMPWHFAAEAFAVNPNPVASGQALVEDPFTLDALLQSKPPSRLSFPPPSPLGGEPQVTGRGEGAGSSSTGGGGASSSAGVAGAESSTPRSGANDSGELRGFEDSAPATRFPSFPSAPGTNPGLPNSSPSGSPLPAPNNPAQPKPDHGHGNPHHPKDAFYVLDANKAIVVTPGTTDNEFSNTSMDLRMQVSAATVSSYSWDYSGAHDVTGVNGGSTYNLTFSWTSFTGTARSETIIAKETPSGGSQVTQTLTFLVAGTNSPAWSTIPTSWSTWSTFPVITPDTLSRCEVS